MSPHCLKWQSARGWYMGTGAQWAIFSCYQINRELHMLSRQASFGCISNSGQPRDIHLSQLPGQPAAWCSSQDRSNENTVTWPASMPVSKLYLSSHCLGYSELGLLTLHGNTGTKGQLQGFKCLTKVARKVSSPDICFHNKSGSRIITRWVLLTTALLFVKHL